MSLRTRTGGEPAKTRRRKTVKRRNAAKAVVRRGSSAVGQETKLALIARERDEALEQLAAASEVLKVISASPGDLKAVFEAILANATRICEAKFGALFRFDGNVFEFAAEVDTPAAFAEFQRQRGPFRPPAGTHIERMMLTKRVSYTADYAAEPVPSPAVKYGGARSAVAVPMLKDDVLIGTIVIFRQEVRPFTDKQIALVQNFAAQAVIAIENTRLLNELRQRTDDLTESLEQQTATSELLEVINSSPSDLAPVFDAMLEKATSLCEAAFGILLTYDGTRFHHAALQSVPRAYAEYMKQNPPDYGPQSSPGRVLAGERVVHLLDAMDTDIYRAGEPNRRAIVNLAGARTILVVPLLQEEVVRGAIVIFRQEVRPFSDRQIALLQNFAAQAVIAMENARLLNELRQRTDDLTESLEQQTATSEVLKVISSSPSELQPVFDTMLENVTRLCEAPFGVLLLRDGGVLRIVASHVPRNSSAIFERGSELVIADNAIHPLVRMLDTKDVFHVADLRVDLSYTAGNSRVVAFVETWGAHSGLLVPMMKDDECIGAIGNWRQEVRPFTDKQIKLVQNFAAQAVIAIENTRLLNELQQSLEQQTATADVLRVISSSPGELRPVFQSMLENSVRICDAKFGNLLLWDGDVFRRTAMHNAPEAMVEHQALDGLIHPDTAPALRRLLLTKQLIHIPDVAEEFPDEPIIRLGKARTFLIVPLLKDDKLIGALGIYRQEVRPFTDKQIALVTNFAAQAVIAIENTRLLNELRQRTDDLTESLDRQMAMSEVLGVISGSPSDIQPVFEAIVQSAARLCEADNASIYRVEGGVVRHEANHGQVMTNRLAETRPLSPGSVSGRAILSGEIIHVDDLLALDETELPDVRITAAQQGVRTVLGVPLMRGATALGAIVLRRMTVRPFTDKQIELVQNFAAQAVIAIENTRLLNELRQRTDDLTESLEQQTATANVLEVISRSAFDLNAVFETVAESSVRLCGADRSFIFRYDGELLRMVTSYNARPGFAEWVAQHPIRPGRHSAVARAALERRTVHIPDAQSDPEYSYGAKDVEAFRTVLTVPMLKGDDLLGVILTYHLEVRPFTDKQIALVETFADQAAIAVENVRLFEAEQQRTRELAQSLDDLRTAQDRLVQTQKLASLGQLTAGIAHEIKNPLNFVNNFSAVSVELIDELQDVLESGNFDDKARADIADLSETLRSNLDKIVQHGKRADAIVKNMLLHSREGSGEHRQVDINALVEESLNLAYHGARAEKQGFNITLERSFDPSAGEVDLFPQEITRVLLNLIANGFYAATKRKADADGGNYEPTLAAATKSLGSSVEIRIRDNGTGIPPEVKEKLFNPFFTTKPAGEGTGLGLSISHDIVVKQHGGSIEVDTQPGVFTEFRIVLPRAGAPLIKAG